MPNDEIDLDRVVSDPGYRRQVIERLKGEAPPVADDPADPVPDPVPQAQSRP